MTRLLVLFALTLIGIFVIGVVHRNQSPQGVVDLAAKGGFSPVIEVIGVYDSSDHVKRRLLDGNHRQFHRIGFFWV